MQIQLKQREIEAALKMYIASQGLDLTGKVIEIGFTAGRGTTGLSADIDIQDIDIPGFDRPEPGNLQIVKAEATVESSDEVEEDATEPAKAEVESKTGASLFS